MVARLLRQPRTPSLARPNPPQDADRPEVSLCEGASSYRWCGDSAVASRIPVGTLVQDDCSRSTCAPTLLLNVPGVSVRIVGSLDALIALAQQGRIGAALINPEWIEGWPVHVAERIVDGIRGLVPVIVVCCSATDARLMGARFGKVGVTVVEAEALTKDRLGIIVRSVVEHHRLRELA